MTSYEKQKDTERGISQTPSGPTPSERFLLFRDLIFVCIILFHLATAIMAIPGFVFPINGTRGHLVMFTIVGILAPLFTLASFRDHYGPKFTSTICFEFSWTATIAFVDFVVAVAYSAVPDASKAMIAFAFVQTITMMLYVIGFGGLIWLQHRRFLNVTVWWLSAQTVQWLRSSDPVIPGNPSEPPCVSPSGKTVIPPWDLRYDDMHEIKLDGPKFAGAISPDKYVNAHPFWQERVQRQVEIESDIAYVAQRYGLDIEANKMKPHFGKTQGHAKRPSIRELGISRPIPAISTVRRANTLAAPSLEQSRHHKHQQSGSIDGFVRPTRRGPPPHLRLQVPSVALDVPEDVIALPTPAAKVVHPNPATRSLGLASRTLVGSSRPKASGTRAYVDTSKPLPSPPPYEASDLSLPSSGPSQGSSNFIMAMAHRVKISASNVRPLMVSTPKAGETPIEYDEKFFI
ncbi:hypothetical protein M408DRAFT_332764 [Serendipita vermifera MAFF 305830]|uniref:Uncharacterized protein n=1 Tax=Serendipita vermifera MAFF 305830 TaxID=933852 RepID=A0A0C3ARN7_SERVB|nr:hypothetical protein M408DRAFT_332764 [Serendipita vermifera MAFF 305830]